MPFRTISLFLLPLALLWAGCGEYAESFPSFEEALGKVFVTGSEKEGISSGDLSKETVEKLNLQADDEATVISNLTTLKDKDFNISDNEKNVLISLNYITTIVRRSELLPKDKQSPCQCHYAASTFKLAVEVLGGYLLQLQKQNLSVLAKEDLEKFQELYNQFSLGKEILEELSKVDVLRLPMAKGSKEREELEEIKKVAAEALKKLSSAGTSESAKPSGTKK
ncbi:MAG: hypothetical protein AAB309_00230 [Deltaproteobacteria bacterium]